MTNEEMDRAIAEYLGADCMTGSRFATWPVQAGEMLRKITVHVAQSDERYGRLFAQIPNFSTDLNAMHEAENVILQNADTGYDYDCIMNMVCETWEDGVMNYMKLWHATANQRAEAFLRTVGKWRDE